MALMMLPGPAISTSYDATSARVESVHERVRDDSTFSCQLSSTLIPEPPLSPSRVWTWENPVGCGETEVLVDGGGCDDLAIPRYLHSA